MPGSLAALSRSTFKTIVYRYGPVVASVAAAVGVSVVLRGYLYPRPLILLALVLSIWGRGLGPGLVGAGFATVTVSRVFPELLPTYGMVSDAAMFLLAAVTFSAFSGTKLRAEAERKLAERRLRASEHRFIDAQRLAQVGSWERYFESKAIYWSDEMFRIFGLPVGAPPDFLTFLKYVHPDDREKIFAADEQARSRSGPVILEYRLVRPDGDVRFVRTVVEVIKDGNIPPLRIAGATQDITEQVEAKAALRESEERFRAIFFQAAVGIAQVGLQGEWLLVNDRLCEILGYMPAELRTKTFLEMTHADDRERLLTWMRRLLDGELSSLSNEIRYVRKDGTIGWASLYVSLVRDREHYFIAVVEDITDRVQAERALRESERRLTLVQSAARLGVWDCDLRTNRTTTFGDYARQHGLAPDHPPLAHEEWLGMIHPADRERVEAGLLESVERTHVWDNEFRVRWPDGSVHWLLGKGRVYVDDAGRPVSMAGVSLDITEGKEAEDALRESEERFRRVFEEGPLGFALVGKDYHLLKVNSAFCRMVGYTESELTQMSFEDITHPEDLAANRELAQRLFRHEIPSYKLQKRYVKKDGDIIWINLTASVIRDAEGLPLYGLAMIEDITESKRTQEEAIARQKLESLGVLAGGIAHDFNNLLGSILAEAELAAAELATGSSPSEELQRIMTTAVRGAEIVRELMIYSGQDKAKLVEPVDVSLLVEEMLELLKISISKHVVLKTGLSRDLPAVLCNAPQLRQVVMNLIINASEASGEQDAVISITTSRVTGQDLTANGGMSVPEGNYVRLEVADTGCGMTAEVQAKIFDPFFTTKFAGRGLGLAVVQGIVREHGGTINLASTPGHGTIFQILLPAADEPAQRNGSAYVSNGGERAPSTVGTVLLVEDEDALRVPVARMLRKKGFFVVEAGDGFAAVELFRRHPDIALMLLDMTIPGTSSRDVIAEAQRVRPDIKIILTSAYSREMATQAVDSPLVKGFIRKPFPLADVVELLRNTLSS